VLAHALEANGLATVQLASVRSFVERALPPRALYCEFPLGRPLGKPGDAAFQRSVLKAAFALLERPAGPVLEDFPERIGEQTAAPLACAVPLRHDPGLPPAVDEALGLRAAYERQLARSGRTNVGHTVDADRIPEAVAAILRLAEGTAIADAALPGPPRMVALDLRAYYEEAALSLAPLVPGARQAESWFFRETETGRALIGAQAALRESRAPQRDWLFLVPTTQGQSYDLGAFRPGG
jgi:hypothetical protein